MSRNEKLCTIARFAHCSNPISKTRVFYSALGKRANRADVQRRRYDMKNRLRRLGTRSLRCPLLYWRAAISTETLRDGALQLMTTEPTQLEKPSAPAEEGAIEITRHWNCVHTRWPCDLCGGYTEKQDRHYQIGGPKGEIICDECGEHPDQIPARLREHAARLRRYAECNVKRLENNAQCRFVRNLAGDDREEDDPWRGFDPGAAEKINEPGEIPF